VGEAREVTAAKLAAQLRAAAQLLEADPGLPAPTLSLVDDHLKAVARKVFVLRADARKHKCVLFLNPREAGSSPKEA
jgi:hypothetical protein